MDSGGCMNWVPKLILLVYCTLLTCCISVSQVSNCRDTYKVLPVSVMAKLGMKTAFHHISVHFSKYTFHNPIAMISFCIILHCGCLRLVGCCNHIHLRILPLSLRTTTAFTSYKETFPIGGWMRVMVFFLIITGCSTSQNVKVWALTFCSPRLMHFDILQHSVPSEEARIWTFSDYKIKVTAALAVLTTGLELLMIAQMVASSR